MGNVIRVNKFGKVKQPTEADRRRATPISERDEGVVIGGTNTITLPFSVDTARLNNFLLFVDGHNLREDALNDFEFTNIRPNETSKNITLTATPGVDVDYLAINLGIEIPKSPTLSQIQSQLIDITPEVGQITVPNAATARTIALTFTQPDLNYAIGLTWFNSVDGSPAFQTILITNKTTTSFSLKWNSPTDTVNYKINYIVERFNP